MSAADGAGGVATLATGVPMLERKWYLVAASFDAASRALRLYQRPLDPNPVIRDGGIVDATVSIERCATTQGPLLIAALSGPEGPAWRAAHFNGKVDRPRLFKRAIGEAEIVAAGGDSIPDPLAADVIGAWDFARSMSGDRVEDMSPRRLDGRIVNLPSRAVKGHNWTGGSHDWRVTPGQYGAIHFHDDDLYDAGWETDFTFTVPADLRSGTYAVRLRAGTDVSYAVFFVRPAPGKPTQPLAFLASTATYMAYANTHYATQYPLAEVRRMHVPVIDREEAFLEEHRELGLSTYDTHSDGSGVRFASRLRPVLDTSPRSRIWNYAADTHITDWLTHLAERFDVITDEDLHREGLGLLLPYRTVLTGSHPEYWTSPMWAAMRVYLDRGGRLMYLGGNGFYWRCALSEELPGVVEVRRSEGGARYWAEEPGEYHLAFTGEYGGLWRRTGLPPQTLVGIGTKATGFDRGSYYRQREARHDPRVSFMFEGIAPDELIGNFGSIGGGGVFSTGSIAWAASLAHEGYDNNVARLTGNVLRRFLAPDPL